MGILGVGTETYLYVNGLHVSEEIHIDKNKVLLPVHRKLSPGDVSSLIKNDIDYSIVVLCSGSIAAQLKITAESPKQLATIAWNSQWDLVLLSAIFDCDAVCNLQCTHPIDAIANDAILHVTNYHMRGFGQPYTINTDDSSWINQYFACGQSLLEKDSFQTAVHSLATYRWHSVPRVKLAIIWAGIESLFGVSTELSFRISLYVAKFLANDSTEEMKELFTETKALYNARSSAVHGGKIKGDSNSLVEKSACLLNKLLRKCIASNAMPNPDDIIFK